MQQQQQQQQQAVELGAAAQPQIPLVQVRQEAAHLTNIPDPVYST
jgi:hypothetical protein